MRTSGSVSSFTQDRSADRLPIDILEGQPPGDLLLVCSDGVVIRAHSQILMLASTVLRNALNTTLKVEGSSSTWRLVLLQLYPIHPRPELSYSLVKSMIKVVKMYDMGLLQASMLSYLFKRFPAELSSDPGSETYVMSWLVLADELQLDELRDICMRFLRGLAFNGRLEDTLLQRVVPAAECSEGGSMRRVGSLKRLSRSSLNGEQPPTSGGASNGGAGAQNGGGTSMLSDPSTWHQDDRPELHDSLRHLSRSTLEELLASLAMACSMRYWHHERQRPEDASKAMAIKQEKDRSPL
ncbi:hypothetical protein CEUSTIGMA_g4028.t1 [Chlamydomonas eustigma]|uniref:Uncharacterized protein n=1 Tax=Chlamydomonas eustigma TaxID=1157962 RepID=A0A250X120_9CHLO|nr:hypothetical protein CEUSTIGMA_g4028.t1 [Chlamydomonas eustigma]|eukprot:GAX76582.1 hypothetical protein CEUSTIGMA_g4028.t1 [Chlamydomonas eustigma]